MRTSRVVSSVILSICLTAIWAVPVRADLTDSQFFSMLNYAAFPGGSSASVPGLDDVHAAYLANNLPLAKQRYLEYRRKRTEIAPSSPSRTTPVYFSDVFHERDALVSEKSANLAKICGGGANAGNGCTSDSQCPSANCVYMIKRASDAALAGKLTLGLQTCDVGSDVDWCPAKNFSTCMTDHCCEALPDLAAWYHTLYRWDWVPDVVWTYLKFNDEAFAGYLLDDIVTDFSDDTTVPITAQDAGPWRTLEASKRTRHLADIDNALLFSPTMTAQRHFVLLKTMVEHATYLYMTNAVYHPGNFGQAQSAGGAFSALTLPEFTDSVTWLRRGIERIENHLVTGFGGQLADVHPSGWSSEYSADYHEPGARQFLDVFYLIGRNGMWSDTAVFNPSVPLEAARPRRLLSRHREMVEAMYRYKAPDGNVLSPNDSTLSSREDLLGLGTILHGDGMWKTGSDRPDVGLLGLDALKIFDSIPERARTFPTSMHDPDPTDFITMRSDAENEMEKGLFNDLISSSDMMFFDVNDTALKSHEHDDILNVSMFALGDHLLRDTGLSGASGFAGGLSFHNLSI